MTEVDLIRDVLEEVAAYAIGAYERRAELSVTRKSGATDLLTEADEEIQRRIAARIQAEFPGEAIVGEELGMHEHPPEPSEPCWVVDPIDGTQNFVAGLFPAFGISVARVHRQVPTAGGVILPITGDLFLAEQGAGATRNGERIEVSRTRSVDVARVEVDFSAPPQRPETLARFAHILEVSGQLRSQGAAVVGMCSVATGDSDAYCHVGLSPWDYAAAALLVSEAGGRVTRLNGRALRLFDPDQSVLASNAVLHDDLRKMMRPA
ncbi:MAG: inositol monophosphatase [Candidatus Hydrogenedentes bacterium]|nr:inositol monophosphatase [Candidatus Hydrogenedentota bacterium]